MKITRKTKIGWGYTFAPEVCDFPTHTGTVKTIETKISADRGYQSRKNNMCLNSSYFGLVAGEWLPLDFQSFGETLWLYAPTKTGFRVNEVEVKISK